MALPLHLPYPVEILGTGRFLPQTRWTSEELDARYDRPPGASQRRSGVRSRRYAAESETSSMMAAAALRLALEAAELGPESLDLVLVASVLPEQPMPTNAVLVLRELGLGDAGTYGFDVNASCLGFLTAFEVAATGIVAGRWSRVGIVASEVASKALNSADIESSALFGDGAAACVVGLAGPRGGTVRALRFETYSRGASLCRIEAGGTRWNVVTPPPDPTAYLFSMDGLGIFKQAAETLPAFLDAVLAEAQVTRDGIDVVVPHQASQLGLRFLVERLGFPAERVINILAESGNQVSASIPSALDEAISTGRLARGDTALLLGTAAGLSLGAAVIRY